MNILVVGAGNVYQSSYKSHAEKAVSNDANYVVVCDANPDALAGEVNFVASPTDWNNWDDQANRDKILGQKWDAVIIATTPQYHCHIAEAVARSQIGLQYGCVIVVEKPIDLDVGAIDRLVTYLEQNDSEKFITLRVIDHYRGKWAIVQAQALLKEIGGKSITRAMFVSYEQNPMWESRAFEDGYLIEHGMHAPAALDKAVGIGTIRRDPAHEPEGARYEGAPTKHDTWARADFLVTTRHSNDEFPFIVAVGKAVGDGTEKWLRVDGTSKEGNFILWANIDGKSVISRVAGKVGGPYKLPEPDGYDSLLPDILAGNVDKATVPFDEAFAWMKPLMDASQSLRHRGLPTYAPGEYPLSAKQTLDELKDGMP